MMVSAGLVHPRVSGRRVIDVLDGEVEVALVPVMGAATLGAAVGQHAVDARAV
jgi:hypothetical protein